MHLGVEDDLGHDHIRPAVGAQRGGCMAENFQAGRRLAMQSDRPGRGLVLVDLLVTVQDHPTGLTDHDVGLHLRR